MALPIDIALQGQQGLGIVPANIIGNTMQINPRSAMLAMLTQKAQIEVGKMLSKFQMDVMPVIQPQEGVDVAPPDTTQEGIDIAPQLQPTEGVDINTQPMPQEGIDIAPPTPMSWNTAKGGEYEIRSVERGQGYKGQDVGGKVFDVHNAKGEWVERFNKKSDAQAYIAKLSPNKEQ